jgi:hypothetical protein
MMNDKMNIRFKLILAGVLPAMTEDYEEEYLEFAKKHSNIMATDYVIHEYRKTLVLYNKKFQKLVDNCKAYKRNEKAYGKLLGYTELLNLYNVFKNTDFKIIGVHYSLHNKVFFGYWKMKKNTDMKKELVLLDKMKKIDNNIELSISFSDP